MYVNVRVDVTDYEKLLELIRAIFVEEFDTKTGIRIEDNKLFLKLHFEKEPPQQSIYALTECGAVKYLEYNFPKEKLDDSTKAVSECGEESGSAGDVENVNESFGDNPEGKEKADVSPEHVPTKLSSKAADKLLDIPELYPISKGVSSVDEYLTKVTDFLGIPKEKCDAFINLVKIYSTLKKPTWKNISDAFKEQNMRFNTYDKKLIIDAVSNKLGLPFLKVVSFICREMAGLDFSSNDGNTENIEGNATTTIEDETQIGQANGNVPYKLFSCMPDVLGEKKNEQLLKMESALIAIDKSLPMEEKIRIAVTVFSENGFNNGVYTNDPDKLKKFIIFTQRAMSGNKVTFAQEVVNPEGATENTIRIHILNWSNIAKNIAKMYDPYTSKEIKAIEFLEDLRKILF